MDMNLSGETTRKAPENCDHRDVQRWTDGTIICPTCGKEGQQ